MIKKIFISVIIVFFIGLFFAYKNVNSIIAKFLPDIQKTISSQIGYPIKFGKVDISIFPKQALKISGTRVGEGIKLDDLEIKFSLLEIFKKNLLINAISIRNLNLDLSEIPKLLDKKVSKSHIPKEPTASSTSDFKIELEKFSLDNCKLILPYKNRKLEIKNITLETGLKTEGQRTLIPSANLKFNFANTDFKIDVDNVSVESQLAKVKEFSVSFNKNSILFFGEYSQDGTGNINLKTIIKEIKSLKPIVQELEPNLINLLPNGALDFSITSQIDQLLPKNILANLKITNANLKIADQSIDKINGEILVKGDLNNLIASSKDFSLESQKLFTFDFEILKQINDIIIQKFNLKAFSGITSIQGDLKNNLVSLNILVNDLNLGEITEMEQLKTLPILGRIKSAKIDLSGDLAKIQDLNITGNVEVLDGKLKGFNLINKLISALNKIESFMTIFGGTFPQELNSLGSDPDTLFGSFKTNFKINSGNILVDSLSLIAPQYYLTANGSISKTRELDLNSSIFFNSQFSSALCLKSDKFCSIQNNKKEIVIPLILKGTPPLVVVLPDIKELSKLAIGNKLKEKAGELIEKNIKGQAGKAIGGLLGF